MFLDTGPVIQMSLIINSLITKLPSSGAVLLQGDCNQKETPSHKKNHVLDTSSNFSISLEKSFYSMNTITTDTENRMSPRNGAKNTI